MWKKKQKWPVYNSSTWVNTWSQYLPFTWEFDCLFFFVVVRFLLWLLFSTHTHTHMIKFMASIWNSCCLTTVRVFAPVVKFGAIYIMIIWILIGPCMDTFNNLKENKNLNIVNLNNKFWLAKIKIDTKSSCFIIQHMLTQLWWPSPRPTE